MPHDPYITRLDHIATMSGNDISHEIYTIIRNRLLEETGYDISSKEENKEK